jgi:hypothetical protein
MQILLRSTYCDKIYYAQIFYYHFYIYEKNSRISCDRSSNWTSYSFLYQNDGEYMFFQEQKRIFSFWLDHLVDGVVSKLFRSERYNLCWKNGKWLDEGDVVKRDQVSFYAWFVELIHCH